MYLSLLLEICSPNICALLAWDLSCILIITNDRAAAEESMLLLTCITPGKGKLLTLGKCCLWALQTQHSSQQQLYCEMEWSHRWHTERYFSVAFFSWRTPAWPNQILVSHVFAETGCLQKLPYMLPFNTSLPHHPDKTLSSWCYLSDVWYIFLVNGLFSSLQTRRQILWGYVHMEYLWPQWIKVIENSCIFLRNCKSVLFSVLPFQVSVLRYVVLVSDTGF